MKLNIASICVPLFVVSMLIGNVPKISSLQINTSSDDTGSSSKRFPMIVDNVVRYLKCYLNVLPSIIFRNQKTILNSVTIRFLKN